METSSEAKSARLLTIYARLLSDRTLRKAELAAEFGVTQRSIQRDLDKVWEYVFTALFFNGAGAAAGCSL